MKPTKYRLLRFSPHPLLDVHYPMGVVVEDANGVRALPPTHPLGPASVGGESLWATMQSYLAELDDIRDFNHLPSKFLAHVSMGEPRLLPPGCDDVARYVDGLLYAADAHKQPGAPGRHRPAREVTSTSSWSRSSRRGRAAMFATSPTRH